MMTTDNLARRLQTAMIAAPYRDWRKMYAGRKTDTGITLAGADTGKAWVRAEEDSREETQVWGNVSRINLPVWVGPNITGELEIKAIEPTEAALTAGAFAAGSLLPPITPDNNVNLLIGGRQFKPGRMRLSDLGGLYVYVEPFHYDGGWWPGGSLELTPTATANKQGWVAVALNPADGALYEFAGANSPTTVVMSENDLGTIAITVGYVPVGAVVLQNAQTTITGTETWADFHYHYAQAGGDISGVPLLAPASSTRNTIQPAGDYPAVIVKNNASQAVNPFQTQTSAGAVNVAITPLGGLVVNEQGADADTRIEGDTDANLLFVDASTDRVGIGTNAPSAKLNVEGAAVFNDAGADVDFRVEGDTRANLLFVDASLDAVGINQASIAASAVLDVASTTKGALIPRMTTTERDAIGSPATGLLVYNTNTSALNFYNGSSWAAVGAGAATITVKEADGTPNVSGVSTLVVSNGTLTDDGGGQVTVSTGGGGTAYSLCQGRLTLTSGTPVTTSDVTAATTLYFTPYKGNQIGLYSGSTWDVYTFSEISLSLSGYTADKNYDIWAYNNSGTVTLDSTVWTNDTTRATALTTQDGVYVKSGATTRRYVGTIRITGTTGQTEDSYTKRYCINAYNLTRRPMKAVESTANWTHSGGTIQSLNNSTANRIQFVRAVEQNTILARAAGTISVPSSGYAQIGLCLDNTNAIQGIGGGRIYHTAGRAIQVWSGIDYVDEIALGFHYLQATEEAGNGTSTFYGGATQNNGVFGSIMG